MDSLVSVALEAICERSASGILLPDLFHSLSSTATTSLGLPLGPTVKQALWTRLLKLPVLNFELHGSAIESSHPSIQSIDESEKLSLKLIAENSMRDSFLGIYDLKAANGDMSKIQRDTLEMLAVARSDGITQNELCKKTGRKGNDFFYVVKSLSSNGLIVRQTTMIREKEQGEPSRSTPSIINTNLLHLYRYGKKMNLNSQQRIEIVKHDFLENEGDCGNGNNEGVSIKDFLPAMKAICIKLEEANGKVLVVSDIKPALGYRLSKGHRAWRNILNRLKEANLVEEIKAKVEGKVVACIKLLKPFNPAEFQPKKSVSSQHNNKFCYEDLAQRGKRGYVTEQYVELPLDHRIYDLVESAGSKGITMNEVGKRLGICAKKLNTPMATLRERFNLVYKDEMIDRTSQYRFWTRKNYSLFKSTSDSQNPESISLVDKRDENLSIVPSPQKNCVDNNWTIVQVDLENGKEDSIEESEKGQDSKLSGPVCNVVKSGGRKRKKDWRNARKLYVSSSTTREERILEKLKNERFLLQVELYKWLESLEKDKNTKLDRKTLIRSLNKLEEEKKCKIIKVSIPSITNFNRSHSTDIVLHPTDSLSPELFEEIQTRHRKFEFDLRRGGIAKSKESTSPVTVLPPNTNPIIKSKEEHVLLIAKMRSNGHLLAKMVRGRLLHTFLWNYASSLPGWNGNFDTDATGSTCHLFDKDEAIKEMPLQIFLQVVGSPEKIDDMVSKCKLGVKLSELPVNDYKLLMDHKANARLSRIIDLLVRLKLIRLVRTGTGGDDVILEHALELRPYIEEPFRKKVPSISSRTRDGTVGPIIRHDFVLSKKETLDAYWETLEYCYAYANRVEASHAFPASSVREVFSRRSWTWTWIMSLEQRTELFKRLANFGLEKIPFRECVTFARDLNLSVEQVLRVSRERRQSLNNSKPDKTARRSSESVARAFSKKRKRTQENQEKDETVHSVTHHDLLKRNRVVSKRYAWTDASDRQLIVQYVKRRVYLGPNIHRADWSSINDLPALPATCRRRMAILKQNLNIRRALSRLCNLLAERYAKYLDITGTESTKEPNLGGIEFCWDDFEDLEVKKAFEEVLEYKKTAKLEYRKGNGSKSKSKSKSALVDPNQENTETNKNADVAVPIRDREMEKLKRRFPNMINNKGEIIKKTVCDSLAVANAVELLKLVGLGTTASESAQASLESVLLLYSESDLSMAFDYLKEKNYMVVGQGSRPYVLSGKFFHDLYSSPFPVGTGKRASELNKLLNKQEEEEDKTLTCEEVSLSLSSDPQCGETVHVLSLVSSGELDLFPLMPEQGIGEPVEPERPYFRPAQHSDDDNGDDDVIGDVSHVRNKRKSDGAELKEGESSVKKTKRMNNLDSRKEKGFPGIQISVSLKMIPRNYNSSSDATSASSKENNNDILSIPVINMKGGESPWDAMREYCSAISTAEISSDAFRSVCSVIHGTGEEGVCMEQLSDALDPHSNLLTHLDLIVEMLQKFGFAIKVNGYDSVRVLDSCYRTKYHMNSRTSINSDDSINNNIVSLTKKSQVPSSNEANYPSASVGPTLSLCEGHKVTIIEGRNTPEMSEIEGPDRRNENEEREEERRNENEEREEERQGDWACGNHVSRPILPWMNVDGSLNSTVFEALTRRVLGTIMQKPGILEEDIIQRMDVLNPQNCRRLLETMILDKHLTVKKIYQTKSGPPSILQGLFSSSSTICAPVCRKHFFANPNCTVLL